LRRDPNIFGTLTRKLFRVTLLTPKFFKYLLDCSGKSMGSWCMGNLSMCHCKLSHGFYFALVVWGYDRLSLGLPNPMLYMEDAYNRGVVILHCLTQLSAVHYLPEWFISFTYSVKLIVY